uniref:Gustatory receptor n=1 Tax=Anopheles dirus TaxID=7168 RepID=A0A182NBW5_9DIPT
MARLWAQLRVLFFMGNALYLIPCRYNNETRQFDIESRFTLVAFIINISLTGVHLCFDWYQVWNGNRYVESRTSFALILLHLLTFPAIIVYIQTFVYTARSRITAFFNGLFADRSWQLLDDGWYVLSCRRLGRFATVATLGSALYLCVVALGGYAFISEYRLLDTILEAFRVYVVWNAVILYVVCVLVVRMRFRQIQAMVQQFGTPLNNARQWSILLQQHQAGVSLVGDINRLFSKFLLMMLLQVQVQVSNQLLVLYSCAHLGLASTDAEAMFLLTQFWETIFLVILIIVGYACEICHQQMDDTNRAVRNNMQLIRADNALEGPNQEAWKRMDQFLLKTLCQATRQRFSVAEFFILDNRYVGMVLTSTITYLVILIQFKQYELNH